MEPKKCDLCENTVVLHCIEIREGVAVSRSLCAAHASEPQPPADSHPQAILALLRDVIAFVYRHGRKPHSGEELLQAKGRLDGPATTVRNLDPAAAKELRQIENLVQFAELNGRMPSTPDERAYLGLA